MISKTWARPTGIECMQCKSLLNRKLSNIQCALPGMQDPNCSCVSILNLATKVSLTMCNWSSVAMPAGTCTCRQQILPAEMRTKIFPQCRTCYYCPQTFLSLDFSVGMTFLNWSRRFGIDKSYSNSTASTRHGQRLLSNIRWRYVAPEQQQISSTAIQTR